MPSERSSFVAGHFEAPAAIERVQAFVKTVCLDASFNDWDSRLHHSSIKVVSASESPVPQAIYELTVTPEMANRLGALHGGATATIFDDLTSGVLAIVAKKDFWQFSGVSRTLTVNYLKPVFVAEVIIVEAEIVDIGQRLCLLRATMKKSDGTVVATAEHSKVSLNARSSQL